MNYTEFKTITGYRVNYSGNKKTKDLCEICKNYKIEYTVKEVITVSNIFKTVKLCGFCYKDLRNDKIIWIPYKLPR